DGSPMPLGFTAAHEPMGISKPLRARRKSLDAREHKRTPMIIQGQTLRDYNRGMEINLGNRRVEKLAL
ncbi:MAG: hypothetical protein ABWJ42_04230, partial [Sulfolobales archaeon]